MAFASRDLDGSRFLAMSRGPGADAAILSRLRTRTAGWSIEEGEDWMVAADRPGCIARVGGTIAAMAAPFAFDRAGAVLRDAASLAACPAAFHAMAPPFRGVIADAASGEVQCRTDACGLGHLFMGTREGLVILSSSAALLAEVLGAAIDPVTLAAYAAFGHFLASETPFVGVTRLSAGSVATLTGGEIRIRVTGADERSGASPAEAVRAVVEAMLRAAPDAELELSGGLDSRIVLAAMPPAARRGRAAITIGVAGDSSGDVPVARTLAGSEGLAWSLLDTGRIASLDADAFEALLLRATHGYDLMGNPLDKAALIVAGEGHRVRARFGGQNGEILRGFYYSGQPLDAEPSTELIRRLIAWRLTTNDAVDAALLSAPLRGELRRDAENRMLQLVAGLGGSWAQTLDRLYLVQRMQSWVGNSASNRTISHVPLYPFFDADYLAAAFATPPAAKRNSAAAYRLLAELDPGLARRPLDSGITPARFPASALGQRVYGLRLDAGRLAKRVQRRFAGGMATLGSQSAAERWQTLGLHWRLPLDDIARTQLIDPAALERIASGQWLPNRPTLGFLLLAAGLGSHR